MNFVPVYIGLTYSRAKKVDQATFVIDKLYPKGLLKKSKIAIISVNRKSKTILEHICWQPNRSKTSESCPNR